MKRIALLILLLPAMLFASDWKIVLNDTILNPSSIKGFKNCCFIMAEYCSDNVDECGIRVYKSINKAKNWNEIYRSKPWKSQEYPFMGDIYSGFALDRNNLYLTSQTATIIQKSSDGGKTFIRMPIDTNILSLWPLDNICMFDTNYGFVTYNKGFYTTKNGWKSYTKSNNKYFSCPKFLDSNTICMLHTYYLPGHDNKIGEYFVKYHINENKFDTLSYFPRDSVIWVDEIEQIFFINDSLGFACGQRYNSDIYINYEDIIYRTKDGGKHWNLILKERKIPQLGLQDICFLDEKHGLAVGQLGKIWMTKDGGDNWTFDSLPNPNEQKYGLRIAWSAKYPIISVWSGRVYRYEGNFFDLPPDTTCAKIAVSGEDFGKMQINDYMGKIMNFRIHNTSKDSYLVINGKSLMSTASFRILDLPPLDSTNDLTIDPDSTFIFRVQFRPNFTREYSDSIVFHSNATQGDSIIYLRGEGIDSTVSVGESKAESFEISPNPTDDYIEISSASIKRGLGAVSELIKIYNTLGECVITVGARHAVPNQRIDVSALPAGVYFVRCGGEVGSFVKI